MRNIYNLLIALLLGTTPALGQTSIFLETFPRLEGGAQQAGFEGQIEVVNYEHSLSNPIDLGGIGGGGGSTNPAHEPVVFGMEYSAASVGLWERLNTGERLDEAIFRFTRPDGKGGMIAYLEVRLTEVFVVSQSIFATDGSGIPFESYGFLYAKIEIEYWPTNPDGSRGPSVTSGWDVTANRSLAVEMSPVDVLVDGADVLFRWTTFSESGNYGFEIQHREFGEFKRAAYVPGAGWSSLPLEYEVRIRGLEAGVHVFRVAALSVGGERDYSAEVSAALGVPEGLILSMDEPYPNPTSSVTRVAVTSQVDQPARVSVWDMLGREVSVVHEGLLNAGRKTTFTFDATAEGLSAGVYVIRTRTGRGIESRLFTVAR